jgi:hypothetical protein
VNPRCQLFSFLQVLLGNSSGKRPEHLRRRPSATKSEPTSVLKMVENVPVDAKLLKVGPQASHTLAEL